MKWWKKEGFNSISGIIKYISVGKTIPFRPKKSEVQVIWKENGKLVLTILLKKKKKKIKGTRLEGDKYENTNLE